MNPPFLEEVFARLVPAGRSRYKGSMSRASVFGGRANGLRLERIRASPRFRGGAFQNTAPVKPGLKPGTALSTLGEYFSGSKTRMPPGPLPLHSPLEAWSKSADSRLRVTWLGHSTVLLEVDGVRVLTDPVWGSRASPLAFAGPLRFHPVPVSIAQLPPLDAVVISHDHYDHLDFTTILELAKLPVPFITSLGVGAHLEAWGVPAERIVELDWWDSTSVRGGELQITAAPSQHFSGRGLGGRNATAWSSFVLKGDSHSVFFSGDTGLTDEYREIGQRLGPFDLVMLEVGAWHPNWGDIHLGPEGALQAHALLGSGLLMPVHWSTFNLAMHAWDQPAEALLQGAPASRSRLFLPPLGAAREPLLQEALNPWWRGVQGPR